MENVLLDLRYGWRLLRKNPGFAASPPNFLDWRAQNHAFSGRFAFLRSSKALTGMWYGTAARVDPMVALRYE